MVNKDIYIISFQAAGKGEIYIKAVLTHKDILRFHRASIIQFYFTMNFIYNALTQ